MTPFQHAVLYFKASALLLDTCRRKIMQRPTTIFDMKDRALIVRGSQNPLPRERPNALHAM